MKEISFIHAADLHLDSPMVGLEKLPEAIFSRIKESTFTALKKITLAAIEHEVDFVILAGDLFDGEDRSLRAQSFLRTEMLKLEKCEIPVYIVHGNHDHLNGSWVELKMPQNVHVFGSEVEKKLLLTKNGAKVHLYGFSYPTRHVFERKIDFYQKVPGADFHIGILHGNETSGNEHENYAPFSVKDLQSKDFDYWALGHIHKRLILAKQPMIVYPGNIQGRNRKEQGMKGFYHVCLHDDETTMNFIEAADIVWEEAEINVAAASSFHEVFQLCQSTINCLRKQNTGTLLTIHLNNLNLAQHDKKGVQEELLELLADDGQEEENFVHVVKLEIREQLQIDKKHLRMEAGFYKELFHIIEHYEDYDSPLASLYEHSIGRKYAPKLSLKEQQELLEHAEKILLEILLQ
ncbi:metallophosphoesterase family protein [Bacillus rubiinfantis]|uniref:metallophosphoesterase family protein n=1 Tax=Bacillus rubiinfantis TaxID=1499680 RepID=UPI0005A8202E|nr:DNA repair exonuclease [Bacillus rubiinfantis]